MADKPNTKHARDIKHSEAYIGMIFRYDGFVWQGREYKERIGVVTDIKTSPTGRIKLFVKGELTNGAWSNGPVNPESKIQTEI